MLTPKRKISPLKHRTQLITLRTCLENQKKNDTPAILSTTEYAGGIPRLYNMITTIEMGVATLPCARSDTFKHDVRYTRHNTRRCCRRRQMKCVRTQSLDGRPFRSIWMVYGGAQVATLATAPPKVAGRRPKCVASIQRTAIYINSYNNRTAIHIMRLVRVSCNCEFISINQSMGAMRQTATPNWWVAIWAASIRVWNNFCRWITRK